MKQYKSVIVVLCCCLFVLLVSGTYVVSYAQFVKTSTKTTLFNGTIYGNYADITITNVYSNGTSVAGMNAVPAGYSLDQEMTGCKFGSSFYTNANNETVINSLNKGDRCELYYVPHLSYWDITVSNHRNISPGTVPSGAYNAASLTGYGFYVASNSTKHYLCGNDAGPEICFSQPYTKYGLTGHTAGSNFTSAQQASAKAALENMLARHGINVNCTSDSYGIKCNIGRYPFYIYDSGDIDIYNNYFSCTINNSGVANCS